MSNRTIERAIARKLYESFSKSWRREKRLAGKYGQPGYRRPTFAQWYAIHQRDVEMMAESTPQDVQEYLGLDPWVEVQATPTVQQANDVEDRGERGVATIQIMGETIE